MTENTYRAFLTSIGLPHGLVLVTGATGSGKTTTLYSCLSELNKPELSITTIEDPVEIVMEGINQTQVDSRNKVTFASALRSILRQDPDVILVGEIRDEETAALAVEASLTGHLVFSTLHTNTPVDSLKRLLYLGNSKNVDKVMVSQSLALVSSQRLIRRVCKSCCLNRTLSLEEEAIFLSHRVDVPDRILVPNLGGCSKCTNGYLGRVAVFECMPCTPDIKKEIAGECCPWVLSQMCRDYGFRSLYGEGLVCVSRGVSTLEEISQFTDNPWEYLEVRRRKSRSLKRESLPEKVTT